MIFGIPAWIIWTALLVIFLVFEALTLELVTIWFAIGSIVALLLSIFGAPVTVQVVVMLVVSIMLLVVFIYLIKPRLGAFGKKPEATNADRAIGSEGVVTTAIDPVQGTGLVRVRGQLWSAVSMDSQGISEGQPVVVKDIKGVKLVVEKKSD